MRKRTKPIKVVDTKGYIRCASGFYGIRREEVWVDAQGKVVRYNLAFIHHGLCQEDNGRVFGYDNAHGPQERHWMGDVEVVPATTYLETYDRFQAEIDEIRRTA